MAKKAAEVEVVAERGLSELLGDVADAAELLLEAYDKIPGNGRDAFVGALSTARAAEAVRHVVRQFAPGWRKG